MKSCLLLYLVIMFVQMTNVSATSALCFITTRPVPEMLQFAEELAIDGLQYSMEVFIMIDDNEYRNVSFSMSSPVQILQIPDEKCIAYGYQKTMYTSSRPLIVTSWDKVLLYFCELNRKHSFLWIVEDDTFISSVSAFRAIHQLYSSTSDLVVQRVIPNPLGDPSLWTHWHLAVGMLIPPWYRSMTNAAGLSRRLLTTIADFIRWRGINVFHEFSIHTLGINLNMTVVSPNEFDTLKWRWNWRWHHINAMPNCWWHPVKNWTIQKAWHQR